MQVTDAMVYAAKKQMAAAWGEEHIRAALHAALDAAYIDADGAHGSGNPVPSESVIECRCHGNAVGGSIAAGFTEAELVDTDDLAVFFGVSKSTVTGWAQKRGGNDFPRPVKQRKAAQLFHLGAVKAWHEGQNVGLGDG